MAFVVRYRTRRPPTVAGCDRGVRVRSIKTIKAASEGLSWLWATPTPKKAGSLMSWAAFCFWTAWAAASVAGGGGIPGVKDEVVGEVRLATAPGVVGMTRVGSPPMVC